jgi:hypothetical protein
MVQRNNLRDPYPVKLPGSSSWRPAIAADLEAAHRIGNEIHAELQERFEVYSEKFRLFPEGCFALSCGEQMLGYCLSHPWLLNSIPPLDQLLGNLPSSPDCLLIHDVVVLPEARGRGAVGQLVDRLTQLAEGRRIPHLALVSVYDTYPFWARFGFEAISGAVPADKLGSYGSTARYMRLDIRGRTSWREKDWSPLTA